jgi:cellobiose phosphorylase
MSRAATTAGADAVTQAILAKMTTPRRDGLGLTRIANASGMTISRLPNGQIFAIEHAKDRAAVMINQTLASPIEGAMGGLWLRVGGNEPKIAPILDPRAHLRIGATDDRFVWEGEGAGLGHRLTLWLHPSANLWLWRVDVVNASAQELSCDAVFVQDLGLGQAGFLMNNEAYACQYLDCHIARRRPMNAVLMGRQAQAQDGAFPWAAHGCVEGAAGFATDFRQIMGPAHRDASGFTLPFGANLPSTRLQGETACAALQSGAARLGPGEAASWTFFGLYEPDHPAASSDADLARLSDVEAAAAAFAPRAIELAPAPRSLLQDAPTLIADAFDEATIAARYPERTHVERRDGRLLSFFAPGETYSRHIALSDKERVIVRRHGALLRSGDDMLPDETTLCTTAWMHGVFAAQLTIGNTSFHQLFSVSRDPYNRNRASGLRMLVDAGEGWRALSVPSIFEIGINDCRWIYRLGARTITVSAIVAGKEPAMQWRVSVEGEPCRFLVFGHLTLGEHEYEAAGRIEIDARRKRFALRPDPKDKWGQTYPKAVYRLVVSTPECVEAVGGDELLHADGVRRGGPFAALRTGPTHALAFAVVGSLTDEKQAQALAERYARPVDDAKMRASGERFWGSLTRGLRIASRFADAEAFDTIIPWLTHDAMMHFTAPHGLEQYSGAAWGTRDICQGPIELLLTLERDKPVKAMLRLLFAQQYETRGDWPQWFMLDPYANIQGKEAHGDVVVWPLKALCDYIEATGDFAFLKEKIAWRRDDDFHKTARSDPVAAHVERLIATVQARFIPGTHLIRYGAGDWNDSLQPVDPSKHDWMASSWTVALLYQQLRRYAAIQRRVGRRGDARALDALASEMREDFNRYLIRDGVVAGYGVFRPEGGLPELLLHPSDKQTGLSYSLLPMTQAILGDLFTPQQARRHVGMIRKHLAFPDGMRLMDRPSAYHGGPEVIFRRAESAAFFGREIGLMYVHAHLRYAEAMAVLGNARALWDALIVANPIAVTDRLAHASLRQRNAYFSSSDAAFADRYQASDEWARVKAATIAVDGGWRIYSSGAGISINLIVAKAFGLRRVFGKRVVKPCLPASRKGLKLKWPTKPKRGSRRR